MRDLSIDERIILKWILGTWVWVWLGWAGSGQDPVAGHCVNGNETWVPYKWIYWPAEWIQNVQEWHFFMELGCTIWFCSINLGLGFLFGYGNE